MEMEDPIATIILNFFTLVPRKSLVLGVLGIVVITTL